MTKLNARKIEIETNPAAETLRRARAAKSEYPAYIGMDVYYLVPYMR
jgi:hypothetical protein